MPDDVLTRAIQKRDRLMNEVRALNSFIDMYLSLDEKAQDVEVLASPEAKPRRERPRLDDTSPRPKATPRKISPNSVLGATVIEAERVMRERGGPIPIKELCDILISRGIEIGGKEPSSTLSARLHNSGRFVSNRRLGWDIPRDEEAPDEESSSASE